MAPLRISSKEMNEYTPPEGQAIHVEEINRDYEARYLPRVEHVMRGARQRSRKGRRP
jgi:hypothetical protein